MDTGLLTGVDLPETAKGHGWDGIALILQGGGALGAYQAGVYQALHDAGLEPDWVSGVSIGGINAALIAGNPPERRLERLEEFWLSVTSRDTLIYWPGGDDPRKIRNMISAWTSVLLGQPNFFTPNPLSPWFSQRGSKTATAFYDTRPLKKTLNRLIDFDLLNSGATRVAVGAVNVTTGNFAFFDNARGLIGADHIMASGALPPALPMVRIGGQYYWDGGLVSNTPLQHLLTHNGAENRLVFQVDLFSAQGDLPRDMMDVMARQKDIQYSSRTRLVTDMYRDQYQLKRQIHDLLSKLPDEALTEEQIRLKAEYRDLPTLTILQMIYRQQAYEGDAKDFEFSRLSMKEHWRAGCEDTKRTLAKPGWLDRPSVESGIIAHDIHHPHA